MSKSNVPIVTLVGRANVGKSSLFNAIIGRREVIIAKEAGTTRDSISAKASVFVESPEISSLDAAQGSSKKRASRTSGTESELSSVTDTVMRQEPAGATGSASRQGKAASGFWKDFWIVDTAGLKSAEDDFELSIQNQIIEAADSATLICVVVEASVPPTEEDRRVAKLALKSKKPVILVVNKIDQGKGTDLTQWLKLGIKQILYTSATQKRGLDELLETIAKELPQANISTDPGRIRLALLGRPNVGKSSLFNTLAKKQQALVAAKAGTTRDVNRAVVRFKEKEIELMDTAGIRRSGKIERGVEHFSVLRSIAAIEESDICLLVMDGHELSTQLDQKIAGMIKDAGKGLILVVSKWDAIDKDGFTKDRLVSQIADSYNFVPWAPLIFTSSITGQNVAKIFDLTLEISEARVQRFKTPELNRWLQHVIYKHPPAGLSGKTPKLNYIAQEDGTGMPSFKVFGSKTKYLHWSYKRYLEKSFRAVWPLAGTPLKFWFIEKK